MAPFTTSILPAYSPLEQKHQEIYRPYYILKWRQTKLLVKCSQKVEQPYQPSLDSERWLVERLKLSPILLIYLDPDLGEPVLRLWANAGKQANKAIFLRIPSAPGLPRKRSPFSWRLKRLIDWSVAALLLLTLSPIIVGLVLLIQVYLPGPIFSQHWCIGSRGKLFQLLKFRTMGVNADKLHHQAMTKQRDLPKCQDNLSTLPLGRWIREYSLDKLPQLFNVLRGEMSLVGPRPWTLNDGIQISPEGQWRLNALPGITGAWQVKAKSTLLDLEEVNNRDLEYLHNWSLWRDLKILLLTVPKVLFGRGAY